MAPQQRNSACDIYWFCFWHAGRPPALFGNSCWSDRLLIVCVLHSAHKGLVRHPLQRRYFQNDGLYTPQLTHQLSSSFCRFQGTRWGCHRQQPQLLARPVIVQVDSLAGWMIGPERRKSGIPQHPRSLTGWIECKDAWAPEHCVNAVQHCSTAPIQLRCECMAPAVRLKSHK